MNNKISIIIPVYNVEKYLKQCIESVMNQTYKQLESSLVSRSYQKTTYSRRKRRA